MVVVRLAGGLGNQLFQFAAGYRVAEALRTTLILDTRFLGAYASKHSYDIAFVTRHYPGVEVGKPSSALLDIAQRCRLGRIFDTTFPLALVSSPKAVGKLLERPRAKTVVMDGYFQHPDVILDENERRRLYDKLFAESGQLRSRVAAQGVPLVGVHIRRGDYVTSAAASKRYLTIPISYYHEAAARFVDARFLIFGDDRSVTSSLAADLEGIDGRKLGLSLQEEFQLLAFCDHHIIANSTFSWWASFLGWERGKRVVCPRQWFYDSERNRTNPLLLAYFELI